MFQSKAIQSEWDIGFPRGELLQERTDSLPSTCWICFSLVLTSYCKLLILLNWFERTLFKPEFSLLEEPTLSFSLELNFCVRSITEEAPVGIDGRYISSKSKLRQTDWTLPFVHFFWTRWNLDMFPSQVLSTEGFNQSTNVRSQDTMDFLKPPEYSTAEKSHKPSQNHKVVYVQI